MRLTKREIMVYIPDNGYIKLSTNKIISLNLIEESMEKSKKSVTFEVNGFKVNEKTLKYLHKEGHVGGDEVVTVFIDGKENHKLKVSDIYD